MHCRKALAIRVAAGVIAALACAAAPTRAVEAAGSGAKVDPGAAKLLKKVCDYYAGVKSFRVEAASHQDVKLGERSQTHDVSGSLAARRPNLFAARIRHEASEASTVCDGRKAWIYVAGLKKYMAGDAPADLAVLLDDSGLHARLWNALDGGFLAVLMNPGAFDTLGRDTEGSAVLPVEVIDGVRCRQIRFVQKRVDWAMWVEEGERPILHRAWFDQSKMAALMAGTPPGLKVEVTFNFKNWAVDAELPEDTFKFVAPDGCEQVASFTEEGPTALVGKPAPDFSLDLIDGGKLKLSDFKDKKVVVLDFWTTWCPPCRKALPAVAGVVGGYKGKDVVFYAVNLAEDAETVRKFLKEERLKIPVALDKDGSVAKSYMVTAIPQTVVIGKDGLVKAVHVGMQPDTGEQLKQQLDTLLASGKLPPNPDLQAQARAADWGRLIRPVIDCIKPAETETNAAVRP